MSEKRVFKGWVGQEDPISALIKWERTYRSPNLPLNSVLEMGDFYPIHRRKPTKAQWEANDEAWPPVRVTITVEVG